MCLTKNVTKNNFHVIWSVVHTVSVEAKMSGKKGVSEDRKSVTPKPDAFTIECTENFSAN